MNNPKVSIIITNYNTSNYISKALHSCFNQTYNNLEIIIVDDQSTDNSVSVINSLITNHKNCKLIVLDTNSGPGIARRTGLSNSTGDYTLFLDSDDYINDDYIYSLVEEINKTNPDIISTGMTRVDENGNVIEVRCPKYKIEEGQDRFTPDDTDTKRFLQGDLVKSDLWNKVEYSSRRYIEDTPTLFQLLYEAKRVVVVPIAGYHYVKRNASICNTTDNLKHYIYTVLAAKDIGIFLLQKGISDDSFLVNLRTLQEQYNGEDLSQYNSELAEILQYILQKYKL